MSVLVAGIIPAAGQGTRLGDARQPTGAVSGSRPKALLPVAGVSLLRRSAEALTSCIDVLLVAAPPGWIDQVYDDLGGLDVEVQVVIGGATRQESVRNAVVALPVGAGYVLVHDAARPLVPPEVCARVLDALRGGAPAVVPAIPVADSLRELRGEATSAVVDRNRVRAVQTPQGFDAALLRRAHERAAAQGPTAEPAWRLPDGTRAASAGATDDAALVEQEGVPVTLVEGSPRAFKVTTPLDLVLCEALVMSDYAAAGPITGTVQTAEPSEPVETRQR